MTRYSKVVRNRKKTKPGLLPEAMRIFMARRVVDGIAALLAGAGVFLMLSFASYDRADPAWNVASSAPGAGLHNWMGRPGAFTADLLLQTLGLGAALFAVIALVWGYRIFRRLNLAPLWLRFASAIACVIFAAIAFARIPAGEWLATAWLGGSGGMLLLEKMGGLLSFTGQYAHSYAAALAGIAALGCLLVACAVSRDALAAALSTLSEAAQSAWHFMVAAIMGAVEWVRHYNERDYEEAPRAVKHKKQPKARRAPTVSDDADVEDARVTPRLSAEEDGEDGQGFAARRVAKVVKPRKEKAKKDKKETSTPRRQTSLALSHDGEWEFPSLDLLQEVPEQTQDEQPDEKALQKNADLLRQTLQDFNVQGDIVSIHPGPVVTLYELEPAPGTKSARVISLSDDIARSMSAISVRSAVVPGRNVIGIELPNRKRQTVYMREILETTEDQAERMRLPLILGKDIGGAPVVADLARMPHLLVAGTTGSGKSVAVNTMILSLLYRLPPEKCRFIMIDPKMLELSVYQDIPHLLSPVVTEPGKAVVSLKWAVAEMENRYRAMSRLGVRNIDGYNARLEEARKKGEVLLRKVQTGFDPETGKPVFEEQPMDMAELPYIVVIVDEFADLMLVAGKDVENAIQRLAQMARAAGIHLIMATQRPSVDVITGVIKANFPTRISFQVTSKIDSRTILGEGGAEQLLGMGDMLYMASGGQIKRVHGPFVSDEDVEQVVTHLKAQGEPAYLDDVTEGGDFGDSEVMGALFGGGDSGDELYDRAVAIVAREGKASTSFIQRHLQIGYNKAATLIERMEKEGIISPANHVGKREVLVGDHSAYG